MTELHAFDLNPAMVERAKASLVREMGAAMQLGAHYWVMSLTYSIPVIDPSDHQVFLDQESLRGEPKPYCMICGTQDFEPGNIRCDGLPVPTS